MPTTSSSSTTSVSTITSGGAATTSCTRCATSARGSSSMGEIDAIRREVCALHAELPRNGLVVWTSGNVSARVPGEDLMVIKASGVPYDELTPEAMVVCDLDGVAVEGSLSPSSDAATHGHIYRA